MAAAGCAMLAAAAPLPEGAQTLPRLTGTVVTSGVRQAIFAASDGVNSVVAVQGGRVGFYVVRTISAGQAEMEGPGGTYELFVSAHDDTRARLAYVPANVPLIDPARRETETENDQ